VFDKTLWTEVAIRTCIHVFSAMWSQWNRSDELCWESGCCFRRFSRWYKRSVCAVAVDL